MNPSTEAFGGSTPTFPDGESTREVLEAVEGACYALDREWRLAYLNRGAEIRWNRKREEILGKCVWDVFPEVYGSSIQREFERSLASRTPIRFESTSPLSGRRLELRTFPSERGLLVYSKEMESVRDHRGDTDDERASKLRDEILSTLSHELRTPLNAILGWSQLIRRQGNSSREVERGLDIIEKNARAQANLIDELLDMSSIVSGKFTLNRAPVDLAVLVKSELEGAAAMMKGKAVALDVEVDLSAGSGPPTVWGDSARLKQMVRNLLSTLAEFAHEDSRLRIHLVTTGPNVEVRVVVPASTIEPAALATIFDCWTTCDIPALGRHGRLALAIVRRLVALHGGSVRASAGSVTGEAVVTIALPSTESTASDIMPGAGEQRQCHSRHIRSESLRNLSVLVVDDDDDSRELAGRVLREWGASTVCASSADEALAQLSARDFDVLVSDIGMPFKDGYALIRELRMREQSSNRSTPALALTAFVQAEDRKLAFNAGYQLHLSKPIEPEVLLDAVARLAGRA